MSERGKGAVEWSQAQWEEKFREARELLQKGHDAEAVTLLEELRDANSEERIVRTLLAMAYSRCDRWDDAESMYRELIEDFPEEILLRVRLATLYMQLERDTEARKWLEEIADSAPDSKELHSTLGVIYLRLGEYEKARVAFNVTGEPALLNALEARLKEEGITLPESDDDFLANSEVDSVESISILSDDALESVSIHEAITAELESASSVKGLDEDATGEASESVEGAMSVVVLPPPAGADEEPQVVYVREDVPFVMAPTELGTPSEGRGQIPMGLSRGENTTPLWIDFARLFGDAQREFLLLNDGRLLVQVKDKSYIRLRDLALMVGQPKRVVEHKRFQGESVGQVFGPRSNPIVRVEGSCRLLLQAQEEGFRSSVLLAGGQVAYFREGSVLAFSSSIDWENGRVPSGVDVESVGDLALDQFWGEGEILLESHGPIWGIPAFSGTPVRVAYERLVGWVGDLVPQIVHKKNVADASSSEAFVEFEGEGGVLISS